MSDDAPFETWMAWLEGRYSQALTFREIRKGVAALSRIYVEERGRIGGDVFDGAGKRAAFACFYTPLHYLLVRNIVTALGADEPPPSRIIDIGCGLLPASAAWARACGGRPPVLAVDRSSWAVSEARAGLDVLELSGRVSRKPWESAPMPARGEALILAFAVNELSASERDDLLNRLVGAANVGGRVLVVEPIARRAATWWDGWAEAFAAHGGRNDEWRFEAALPPFVAALDRAARLDHRELTARSLFLPGSF